MMNDSVREELEQKITSGRLRPTITERVDASVTPVTPERVETPVRPTMMAMADEPAVETKPKFEFKKEPVVRESASDYVAPTPPARRIETADLNAPKTSPTLVEFQTQKATLPDWRLQIQNAVQQRVGGTSTAAAVKPATAPPAAKPQPVKQAAPAIKVPEGADPRVAAAVQRVTESRKAFMPKSPAERMAAMKPAQPIPARPFNVVEPRPFTPVARETPFVAPKPMPQPARPMVASAPALKVDTNKLPKLEAVVGQTSTSVHRDLETSKANDLQTWPSAVPKIRKVEPITEPPDYLPATEQGKIERIRIKTEHLEIEATENDDVYQDDIEDLAPISMRFGAGLFDLIIGGFVSMLLLSPVAFSGSNWLNVTGALTFAGVWLLVMFVYMTASIGLQGKTLGMRLFSLELVDAVENEYPTIQQAAVNTALYLVTLPLAGAGFATIFFNEENRALHDLLSGTISVREF
jgi:uncharacterized RDD family membrane protein YckC